MPWKVCKGLTHFLVLETRGNPLLAIVRAKGKMLWGPFSARCLSEKLGSFCGSCRGPCSQERPQPADRGGEYLPCRSRASLCPRQARPANDLELCPSQGASAGRIAPRTPFLAALWNTSWRCSGEPESPASWS